MKLKNENQSYLLGHVESEDRRLVLQAELYDPYTEMFLRKAGIQPGMHILDIGSGMGDVALLAAKLVGSTGQVIGIDSDANVMQRATQRVKALGYSNIAFVTGDVSSFRFDNQFDAIIGRLILCHVKDAVTLLKQLKTYLRSGGLLVFEDIGLFRDVKMTIPTCPSNEYIYNLVIKVFDEVGIDIGFGHKFPQLFAEAGLAHPRLEYFIPSGSGPDWLGYKYLVEGIRTLLPSIQRFEFATEAEIDIDTLEDRLRHEAMSQQSLVMLYPHIVAWTRLD